jgi:hypothetical protein
LLKLYRQRQDVSVLKENEDDNDSFENNGKKDESYYKAD